MGGSIRIYSRANYEDIDCESKCIHVLNALWDYKIANSECNRVNIG